MTHYFSEEQVLRICAMRYRNLLEQAISTDKFQDFISYKDWLENFIKNHSRLSDYNKTQPFQYTAGKEELINLLQFAINKYNKYNTLESFKYIQFLLKLSRELFPTVNVLHGISLNKYISDCLFINRDLTDREKKILKLFHDGSNIDEIAKMLNINTEYLKKHLDNIFRKINCDTVEGVDNFDNNETTTS